MRRGLISVASLAEQLVARKDVRVVDATWFLPNSPFAAPAPYASGREAFEAGPRVPGAAFWDLDEHSDATTAPDTPHNLPDAAQFAELATLVGGMSATCAEKAGKSLGRRVRRGKVKRVGAWLLASAKRFLAERDPARVKHPQPLEDAMHRLRSSQHLKKADFASGTLRDLTLLLPPNAALHVVDGLHSALESDKPPKDVDEALDDAISARLAAAGDDCLPPRPAGKIR